MGTLLDQAHTVTPNFAAWMENVLDWQAIPVAVGAFLGAALSVLVSELIKFQVARKSKRDELRLDRVTEAALTVSRNARTMLHAVGSARGRGTADPIVLSEAHQAVRVGVDHLQMVAGPRVQEMALLVRHHVYSLRQVGEGAEDPRPDFADSVYARTEHAIEYLLDQVRVELGVTGGVVRTPDYAEYERLAAQVTRARSRA